MRSDPLCGALGNRAHGDRMVVRARRPADELLEQRVRDVAELEQADAGDDSERALDKRQASPEEESGHQAPTGAPEAIAGNQTQRLALPESRGPGEHEV